MRSKQAIGVISWKSRVANIILSVWIPSLLRSLFLNVKSEHLHPATIMRFHMSVVQCNLIMFQVSHVLSILTGQNEWY